MRETLYLDQKRTALCSCGVGPVFARHMNFLGKLWTPASLPLCYLGPFCTSMGKVLAPWGRMVIFGFSVPHFP